MMVTDVHVHKPSVQTELKNCTIIYSSANMYSYYMTKAVRGPITNINQSDCFISGPARADIFPVSDRVLSRMIPRDSAQDYCLLNQDDGKYEQYFS